ncbi:MAG: hypothetical protein LBL16_03485 [Endomicrobium sp.]|jgi:hypothetical protein|nr:hypothetical protein [Endomicrobium sp.]
MKKFFIFLCLSTTFFVCSCAQEGNLNRNVVDRKTSKMTSLSSPEKPIPQDPNLSSPERPIPQDPNSPKPIYKHNSHWTLEFNADNGDVIGLTSAQSCSGFNTTNCNFQKISNGDVKAEAIIPIPYITGENLQGIQIGTVQSSSNGVHNLFACFATAMDESNNSYTGSYELHLYLDECQVKNNHIVKNNNYIGFISAGQAKKLCFFYQNSDSTVCSLLDSDFIRL